jgi:hypothetical protein
MLSSLRKSAIILQVSHSTISRWIKQPERLKYKRNTVTKGSAIVGNGKPIMGYAPIGKQLKIQRSAPRRTTTSSLVAASMEQIISRVELQGSFRSQTFSSFLESLPLPSGTVVLLDNVAFHHSKVAKDAAERKGFISSLPCFLQAFPSLFPTPSSSYCLFHLTLLGLIPSKECFQSSRGRA